MVQVLGSADFLGNPMSFMASLGSGMWDFVATPAVSLAQHPQDVIHGVAQGTASLFSNTVFAFSNAATRMSGAAAKVQITQPGHCHNVAIVLPWFSELPWHSAQGNNKLSL